MIREIDARIARALGRIRLAFRALLTGLDTAPPVALFQADALAGERIVDNELMQHYGFTSAPPAGTMAIILPVGGKTAHGVAIATEHGTYRLKALDGGEVAIYDDQGQKVHLTRDGIVVHSDKTVRIEARDIVMHASKSWSWDVNGFGERWTHVGGTTWEHKTWQQGATVTPVVLGINPPEGP